MSQVITNAFEQYWQSSLAAEQPVVLDEFILADIPNLDITSPIDPDTGLPPESQIVHRQNVDQRGRINNNAVAYTIVMDTTVGDFSFNAMYLRNKQNGVIGMIVYKGRETKLKTDQTTGQTGNSLVKSMLMGYDQAAEATLTNVDAGTWQIDYAARLRGQDEDLRQLASQLYGHHTFIGDGFKVVQQNGSHQVTQGVAIVGGLRIELKQAEVIHPGTKPIGVWVDVHRSGSLLSEHQNHFTIITSVADLTDHVDSNGYPHYVAKLATVQADSTVIDGRGNQGLGILGEEYKFVTWPMFAGGADTSGRTSSAKALETAFESGGSIYIPDGNYFIPGMGSDAGGVMAEITSSLNVKCSANAKFFTDSLDNDFIRIGVPADGAGLPSEGIDVDWDGGFFDQRNQRNSTVVPFMAEYPPTKPGMSSTCDGLSIRGYYTSKDGVKSGIRKAHARRVVTMAGEHWQSAGGDTGVFIGGALEQKIELCYFKGNRDLGAYPSAHESGKLKCSVSVEGNVFDSCFHGASAKRGFKSIQITKNTFINCVRAAQSEFISVRNKNVNIYNNTFIGCGINARCQKTDGGGIWGNTDENHGATLENGAIEPMVGLRGYEIESCTDMDVGPNSAFGENPAAAIVYPTQGHGLLVTGVSNGCVLRSNKFRGWRRVGADQTINGRNRWIDNTCPDGITKYVAFDDINNSSEERVADLLGNAKWFRTPVYCFLTDEKNPIIRGYNGVLPSNAGIYFKGPDLGLAGPNVLVEGNIYPVSPNKTLLGAPTSPLAGGTTQSAFTVISDEREKTAPIDITDAMLDAWNEVQLVQFKYLDRVEEKGEDGARWHFGVIAQRTVEAFERHGLNAYRFGFLCHDEWKEKPAEFREPTPEEIEAGIYEATDSIQVSEGVEAGSRYGIRYEEALVLEAALQRRNYQQILKRIEALEAN